MRGFPALAFGVLVLLPGVQSAPTGPLPLLPNDAPDVPPAGLPVARVEAIRNFVHGGDFVKTVTVALPDVDWTRVFLTFHSKPNGDPWDRTFRVGFFGTQVVHGTTTRGDFTVRDDVTEYSALLRGATADVWSRVDSFACCGIVVDVILEFYDDPTAPAQERPFDAVASPFRMRGMGVGTITTAFTFPAAVPTSGTVEFITSGHGQAGEFWYLRALADPRPPHFDLFVDDVLVGTVDALPYVYALVGFCCGATSELINQVLWTPAQTVQEASGVHFVSGEIPSYRAPIPDAVLPLLSGTHAVKVVHTHHGGAWWASLNFLLDYGGPFPA